MDQENDRVEEVLDLIAEIFPENAEKISTIAFVNWHNILNHSMLEELDGKEVLFVTNLIFALSSNHFVSSNKNIQGISNALKEVSFDEAVEFLSDESDDEPPNKKNKQ